MRLVLLFGLIAAPAVAADAVFEPTKVWPIHITLSKAEFDAMQPTGRGGFPGVGPMPPPFKPKEGDENREAHRNVFNVDLPWATGRVEIAGQAFDRVGIRYKGNGTILDAARTAKKSIKIDFDRNGGEATFHGLKVLNIHSGITDPSKCRESLAYAAYRNAGVPAPLTALAEVTLTVPGKFDKELLGVYTLVQQVDKAFLKKWFKTDAGLLMKPERILGLDHLGDDWSKYVPIYDPKRDATPEEQKRVIAFTKLVNHADDEAFRKEIADYLDVDSFLRFMAASAGTVSLDSFFTLGHNYYLYLHPETKKFHFFPWDVDRSLANFAIFGGVPQQMDLSLVKPYAAQKLPDRLMEMKTVSDRYAVIVKEVMAAAFTKEKLEAALKPVEAAVAPLLERDTAAAKKRNESSTSTMFGAPPDLATFIEKRTVSINDQLAGKSKGFVPAGFGFPGAAPAGNPAARPLFDAADGNKDGKASKAEFAAGMEKLFDQWDRNKDGNLDPREVAEGLQRLAPPKK